MSLRVWLPLNGTLDNQGLDDVIVVNNGATVDNSGKIGKCYNFNGSSYLTASLPNLSSYLTTACSMAVWIKVPNPSSGNKQILNIGTSSGWANIRFGLLYRTNSSEVITNISNGTNYVAYSCNASIVPETWVHVATVYQNKHLKLYINGLLKKTFITTYDISFNGITKLGIGAAPNGNEKYTGYLNDVRIYDYALSPMEVKQISQGLILHYPLNNNSINNNIEYDCSGYCNNGIKIGNFLYSDDTPKYNASIVFSGSQYIIESNEINTTDSTIALWIKSTLNANNHILDARNNSGIGKQPIFQYTNGAIQAGGNNAYVTTSTGLLVANTWVHVVLVQSGNSLLVYKNGALFQTISCSNSPIIKPTIGARFNFSNKWTGQLSDFRIYITALSADDVKSLYQNSAYIDNLGNIYGAIYEEV